MGLDRHYGAQTVLNAMEEYRNQPTPFTYPRPPKEEAERLVNIFNSPYYPQFIVSYHRDNLQLRGLDTTYEEEVLTILKGM